MRKVFENETSAHVELGEDFLEVGVTEEEEPQEGHRR